MEKEFSPGDPVEVTEGRFKGRTGRFKKYGCSIFPEYCYIIFEKQPRERSEKTQFIELKNIQMAKKSAISKGISSLLDHTPNDANNRTAGQIEVVQISLSELFPSDTNPRKAFDEDALTDLAKSMEDVGLLQPITVRPFKEEKGYEIVAGERRYRAAKLLNWNALACIVREIPDEELLEIQIIENLQREDVSPMDEAKAFQSVLARESFDWLCSRIHKSKKYVTDRLKLNDLISEAQEFVHAGVLPLTHAIMISKLPEVEQKKCIDKCIEEDWKAELDKMVCTLTIAKLREFIEDDLLVDLENASFDLDSEDLLPEAGSCLKCPKRTSNQNLLFEEITQDDKCTDPSCFHEKVKAQVKLALKTAKEEHGKESVASGTMSPYRDGMVTVKGVNIKFSDQKKKSGQVAVVVTKSGGFNKDSIGKTVYVDKAALTKATAQKEERATGSPASGRNAWQEQQLKNYIEDTFPKIQQVVTLLQNAEIPSAGQFLRVFLERQCDGYFEDETILGFAGLLGVYPSAIAEELYQEAQDLQDEPKMAVIESLTNKLLELPAQHQLVAIMLLWSIEQHGSWDAMAEVFGTVPALSKRKGGSKRK